MRTRLEAALLSLLSLAVLVLAYQPWIQAPLSALEAWATVSLAWAVWLLANNRPLGWWVSLVGVVLYGLLFYRVKLYGEVGLQAFYFVTTLQAIWIWLHGGPEQQEKPVVRLSQRTHLLALGLGVLAWVALRALLARRGGAAPDWDALTTVLSLVAHLYLMARAVESWPIWVAVDVIYVPLYASRELYFTAGLYAFFLLLALQGWWTFARLHAEQTTPAESLPAEPPA